MLYSFCLGSTQNIPVAVSWFQFVHVVCDRCCKARFRVRPAGYPKIIHRIIHLKYSTRTKSTVERSTPPPTMITNRFRCRLYQSKVFSKLIASSMVGGMYPMIPPISLSCESACTRFLAAGTVYQCLRRSSLHLQSYEGFHCRVSTLVLVQKIVWP